MQCFRFRLGIISVVFDHTPRHFANEYSGKITINPSRSLPENGKSKDDGKWKTSY